MKRTVLFFLVLGLLVSVSAMASAYYVCNVTYFPHPHQRMIRLKLSSQPNCGGTLYPDYKYVCGQNNNFGKCVDSDGHRYEMIELLSVFEQLNQALREEQRIGYGHYTCVDGTSNCPTVISFSPSY